MADAASRPPAPPRAPSSLSPALGCGTGILIGSALTVTIVVLLLWASSGSRNILRSVIGLGRTEILVGQPTVVQQIQQLQRLETVVFTLEKILVGKRESPYLPEFLISDRLLLIVHGEVIGGVDLSKVRSEDVAVNGRTVRVRLPKAEIFTVRVDNEKTQVYSRDTGLFSRVDPQLETQVRREGERQLREAAMQNNILRIAEQNARSTLASMLKGFGFEHAAVRVE